MDSRFCEWCGAILDTSVPFEKKYNVCDQACLVALKQNEKQNLRGRSNLSEIYNQTDEKRK